VTEPMADAEPFEDPDPRGTDDWRLVVDLEGFEGPIDVLLHLARQQKVDITRISVLALANQYLAFVQDARRRRLDLAGDYLVMAAWLILLKARLLAPQRTAGTAEDDGDDGEEMAEALRFQLRRAQAMRQAGEALLGRPQLGRDIFARGEPAAQNPDVTVTYACSFAELMRAYARHLQRQERTNPLRVDASNLYAVETARHHLESVLDSLGAWHPLASVLPPAPESGMARRSATASTLAAGLELVREGRLDLRQETAFGPVYVRAAGEAER